MKMNRVLALILSSVMICIAVPGEVMAAEDSMEELGIDDGEEARQEAISAEEVEDNLEIEDESSVDENQTLSVDDDQEFDDGSNEGGDVVAFSDEENKNREVIANGTENELINWMVYDTGELIISGSGDMTDYDVNNLPPWYKYRKNITNVTVENDISSIGSYAFYSLYKLNFVDIKSQCVNVRDHSFEKCTKLISINISERVTSIGANAFSGCSSLASINIPEEVTFIGSNAFSECSSLTSINIPEKVTFIGGSAFSECSSLASINIPEGVTSIDGLTFYRCSSLASINMPEGVTFIGSNAFYGCSSLTNINMPEGLASIGYGAFSGCSNLMSINIPEGVTFIGSNAFYGCSSLISINIPEGITSIDDWTFYGCSDLASINIPEGITSIGRSAFSECSSLTSINMPEGVTSIGIFAFGGCSSLTDINIPEGVTSIDDWTFYGCSSLTSINIPEGVTFIGSNAFYECSSLISINIPEGVTSIDDWTFYGCSSLTSINIPEGVTSIGDNAFSGCSSLISINIPKTVCSIEDSTFERCEKLRSIRYSGSKDEWDTLKVNIYAGNPTIYYNYNPKHKHLYQLKVLNPSTCVTKGIGEQVCTLCGDFYEEEIKATGHKEVKDAAVAATCETNGKTEGSHCSVCDEVLKEQTEVPALGHNWDSGKITKAATCTEAGVKTYTCTRCQKTKTEEIKATGHKEVKDAAVAATCEKAGKTEGSHCSVCGKVIKAQKEVPALGHNWDSGKITKAATCTEAGVKTYTCTRCQKTKTEEIKATGHKEVKDAAVAATCEKAGKTEGSHCSVCGEVIEAQTEVPALGHNWDAGKITKAATCTETGVKTYTCTRCQKTKTEEIKATGHKEVKDAAVAATCEKAGKTEGSHCSVCGKVIKAQKEVPVLGHNWDAGKITKAATCTETGVKTYTCTRCQKTKTEEIKATGHKEVKDAAVAATCEKAGKTEGSHCSVCGKVIKAQKEVPVLGHNWDAGKITKAATCTETGVKTYTCTRCQKTKTEEIKATGHNWDAGKITKAATCTETGVKTYTCTRCQKTKTEEIKATGHKEVKDAAVAATCEKAGKTEGSHCSVCGKVIKAQKEVPVLGHSWDAGKITKAATCTETGVKTHTCIRCQKTKTEEVKATGHKFSAWKTSSKATIYSPAKQTRECTSCHKKQTRDTGKKLKAAIKVSVSKITMQPQQKLGTLKVTFANGDSVKAWKSSNPNIFKVVGKTNGKCTLTAGKIAGTAKLTIKLKSGLTKDVSITVKSVKTTKISGVKSVITLKVKKTTTLKPVLAPKNSTEKITYKSSNSKIVTVNAAGKVVAKKKGTAYIYVKSGSKTVTCKVVVK